MHIFHFQQHTIATRVYIFSCNQCPERPGRIQKNTVQTLCCVKSGLRTENDKSIVQKSCQLKNIKKAQQQRLGDFTFLLSSNYNSMDSSLSGLVFPAYSLALQIQVFKMFLVMTQLAMTYCFGPIGTTHLSAGVFIARVAHSISQALVIRTVQGNYAFPSFKFSQSLPTFKCLFLYPHETMMIKAMCSYFFRFHHYI